MRALPEFEGTLKLTVVSTPIGNLGDISLRALEVLRSVDYILCEDTRRAHKLKSHFSLPARLVSFHEHNEKTRIPRILSLMEKGRSFALISDAGSPLISDPGLLLVRELIARQFPFTFAPGPCAAIAALVLSGFQPAPFLFYGFLPTRSARRNTALQELASYTGGAIVLYESPERVLGLLREIGEQLGDRRVAVCRELTKMHEEVLRGPVSELMAQLSTRPFRGEFTIVIEAGQAPAPAAMSEETVRARFEELQREGLSRKDALKKLVKESGKPRNELYKLLMNSEE